MSKNDEGFIQGFVSDLMGRRRYVEVENKKEILEELDSQGIRVYNPDGSLNRVATAYMNNPNDKVSMRSFPPPAPPRTLTDQEVNMRKLFEMLDLNKIERVDTKFEGPKLVSLTIVIKTETQG